MLKSKILQWKLYRIQNNQYINFPSQYKCVTYKCINLLKARVKEKLDVNNGVSVGYSHRFPQDSINFLWGKSLFMEADNRFTCTNIQTVFMHFHYCLMFKKIYIPLVKNTNVLHNANTEKNLQCYSYFEERKIKARNPQVIPRISIFLKASFS